MGGQGLLLLIGLKILIIMTSLQNIVIEGAQGLLMLIASIFLIKMTRPQNIEIILVLSKLLIVSKAGDLGHPILISPSFQQGLFSSWPLLFYIWGVFGVGLISFLKHYYLY